MSQYNIENVKSNTFTHRGFEITVEANSETNDNAASVSWNIVTYDFEKESDMKYEFYSLYNINSLAEVFELIEEFEKSHTRKSK